MEHLEEHHQIQEETPLEQNFFVKWPSPRSRSESESNLIYRSSSAPIYLRSSSTPIYAGPAARIIQDRTITDLEDKIIRLDRQITILDGLEEQAGSIHEDLATLLNDVSIVSKEEESINVKNYKEITAKDSSEKCRKITNNMKAVVQQLLQQHRKVSPGPLLGFEL